LPLPSSPHCAPMITVAGTPGVCHLGGLATDGLLLGVEAREAPNADAVPAPARGEADIRLRAERAAHDNRRPGALVVARLALRREARRGLAKPDDLRLRPLSLLPLLRRVTGRQPPARSANFANRFRNESFAVPVGPFRCFARCTSAKPC